MESKTEKDSLLETLSLSRITQLNKEWDGKRPWLKAIVKVVKCDNSKNYALADNDGKGNANVTRDFGNSARITKVEAIYPTYYLLDSQKPDLRNKTDIINYLVEYGYEKEKIEYLLGTKDANGEEKTDEQKKADKELIKAYVNEQAVKLQLYFMNKK